MLSKTETTIHSRIWKPAALLALAVMACAGLAGCGGGGGSGGGPATVGGQQVMITPGQTAERPDLVVASASVSDLAPAAGVGFTLSATVRNAGDGDAAAVTLRFYRSLDETITPSDEEVALDAVAGLAASGSGAASVELTPPSTPGTYHYGACADAVAGESDTANNCSPSVRITVSEAQIPASGPQSPATERRVLNSDPQTPPPPDLVVESPSVSDTNPLPGADFTLSATVRNAGDGDASAATVRFYRSDDATITISDTQVGADAVAGLTASGSVAASMELSVPSTPGTYHYGACVAVVAGESGTTNNCSPSVRVTVQQPQTPPSGADPPSQATPSPDLVVESPSVSDANPVTGAGFTLSARVRNAGDGRAAATTLRFYRSEDATITTSDTPVGDASVAELAASGSVVASVEPAAPSTPGVYYYGACVDEVGDESDTTNNCSPSVWVTVSGAPDLVALQPKYSSTNPVAGTSFMIQATVQNVGYKRAGWSKLRFYRSDDATITRSDTQLRAHYIARVRPGNFYVQGDWLRAPWAHGTYYYGACVDAVAGESDTANNCSPAVQITVQEAPPLDLQLFSPRADPVSPAVGGPFSLVVNVRNVGGRDAGTTRVRFYHSDDATITRSDTLVAMSGEPRVQAGRSYEVNSGGLKMPEPGSYYYGACVDEAENESDTTNNCSAAVQVTVRKRPPPDLVVASPRTDPASPSAGGVFALIVNMNNTGGRDAGRVRVRFYRSDDATITRSDTQLKTRLTSYVRAWQSHVVTSYELDTPALGSYYYGACVDAVDGESDTTNNCSAAVRVEVTHGKPNLEVQSVTVVAPPGNSVPMAVIVRNVGGPSAATTLRFYRSTDKEITRSDEEVKTVSVPTLEKTEPRTAPKFSSGIVSVTPPSTPGTYYYGACVDEVPDESDTTDNCTYIRRFIRE